MESPQPESLRKITPARKVLSKVGCGLVVLGAAVGIFGPVRSPTFRHRLEHFLMDPSTGPRWYFMLPLIGIGLALFGGLVFKLATHGHTDPDEESDPSDEPDSDDDSGSGESSEDA